MLCGFLSSCLRHIKILEVWSRALVVAIPKPKEACRGLEKLLFHLPCFASRTRSSTSSYTLVLSRLLTHFSLRSRLGLPWFRDHLLTQNIQDSFEAKKKAAALFVTLSADYDSVWHRGLTCKLLRFLPDKHMILMIMEFVRNRSFTLTTGDSKRSKLRRLQNALPQVSVLDSLPFFSTSTRTICLS